MWAWVRKVGGEGGHGHAGGKDAGKATGVGEEVSKDVGMQVGSCVGGTLRKLMQSTSMSVRWSPVDTGEDAGISEVGRTQAWVSGRRVRTQVCRWE